jgi:hypothetical protein
VHRRNGRVVFFKSRTGCPPKAARTYSEQSTTQWLRAARRRSRASHSRRCRITRPSGTSVAYGRRPGSRVAPRRSARARGSTRLAYIIAIAVGRSSKPARARAVGMQSAGSRDPRLSWCLKDVRPTRNYNIHGEDGVDDVARGRFLIPGPVRANFPFARLSTRVGRAKR